MEARAYWLQTMLKIADPVLKNLAAGTLKQNMPTVFHPDRAEYMHLEAFGRSVCGIAPWLELDGLTGEEAEIQAEYRELTRKAIANAVNPESPDFMNFTEGYGQALVDAAFLAHGIVRAPKQLFRALDDLGIASAKTAVGDKYVYEYMTKNNCRLGGEQSGHIIFSKYASTGDGILTSLKVMEVMCAAKKTLHQLASDLTIYTQKLMNVRVKDKKAALADAKVQEAIRAAEEKLGDTGRVLLRESGTEPVIRVMAEAQEQRVAEACVNEMIDAIKAEGLA